MKDKLMNAVEARCLASANRDVLDHAEADKKVESLIQIIRTACVGGKHAVDVKDLSEKNQINRLVLADLEKLGYKVKHFPATDDGPGRYSPAGTTISWDS